MRNQLVKFYLLNVVRDREVGGSNPLAPTNIVKERPPLLVALVFCDVDCDITHALGSRSGRIHHCGEVQRYSQCVSLFLGGS